LIGGPFQLLILTVLIDVLGQGFFYTLLLPVDIVAASNFFDLEILTWASWVSILAVFVYKKDFVSWDLYIYLI
jgi:hypothetical protein